MTDNAERSSRHGWSAEKRGLSVRARRLTPGGLGILAAIVLNAMLLVGCGGESWRTELTPLGSGQMPGDDGCPDGQEVSQVTDGHCCWPYQHWDEDKASCDGDARCEEGKVWDGKGCRSADVAVPIIERGCVEERDPEACQYIGSLYYLGKEVSRDVKRAQELLEPTCSAGDLESCFTLAKIDHMEGANRSKTIEEFTALCNQGHRDSCAAAASALLFPPDQSPTSEQARRGFALAKKGCDQPTEASCTLVGLGQYLGLGTSTDLEEGRRTLDDSCAVDVSSACFSLGTVLLEEAGSEPKARDNAVGYIERGCAAGSMQACATLGYFYSSGTGVKADMSEARQLFDIACTYRDPDGCTSLATLYRKGEVVEESAAEAARLYEIGCRERPHACLELGQMHRSGALGEPDFDEAKHWYGKASAMGDPRATTLLASLVETGQGTTADPAKALELYKEACQAGDSGGCWKAGTMILDGDAAGDYSEAAGLVQQACEQGNGMACASWGMILESGRLGEPDPETAAQLYRRSCDAGSRRGCALLGHHMTTGITVPRDVALARKYFEDACDEGFAVGCDGLATLYYRGAGVERDLEQAQELYEKACDAGYFGACRSHALLLVRSSDDERIQAGLEMLEEQCKQSQEMCVVLGSILLGGFGLEPDYTRARSLFEASCDAGVVDACAKLGEMASEGYGQEVDNAAAIEHFKTACQSGSKFGCTGLGQHLVKGRGIEKDTERGLKLLEQSCAQREPIACFHLGQAWLTGQAGERDRWLARSSFAVGCDAGHAASCQNLAEMALAGEGGPRDMMSAARAYDIACIADPSAADSCTALEELRKGGIVETRDPAELLDATVRACEERGVELACLDGGLLLLENGPLRDSSRGAELLQKACDKGAEQGCAALAMLYLQGEGVSENKSRGTRLLESSCEAGSSHACLVFGNVLREGLAGDPAPTEGRRLIERACDDGLAQACFELGNIVRQSGGEASEVAALFDEACRGGVADGCFARGHLYVQEGDEASLDQAFERYVRACEMQFGPACFNAGVMLLEGNGRDRDAPTAVGYLQAGCRFADARSCNAYGALRAQGVGGKAAIEEGIAAFEMACHLGDLSGCDNLGLLLAEQAGDDVNALRDAVKVWARACDAGSPGSCLNLGILHTQGPEELRNDALGEEQLLRACQLGSERACSIVGQD